MPFVLLAIDIFLMIHAARTGRFMPWFYVIMLLPGLGGVAYIALELVPEWYRSDEAKRSRAKIVQTADPERQYRALAERLRMADTVTNRTAMAEECQRLRKHDEAAGHWSAAIAMPHGDEPQFFVSLAEAMIGAGRAEEALEALAEAKSRWPEFDSARGHLAYAKCLATLGRDDEAAQEFAALASYYPGPEAKVRLAMVLARLGRTQAAKDICGDVRLDMKAAPPHVRRMHANWITEAEALFKRL